MRRPVQPRQVGRPGITENCGFGHGNLVAQTYI